MHFESSTETGKSRETENEERESVFLYDLACSESNSVVSLNYEMELEEKGLFTPRASFESVSALSSLFWGCRNCCLGVELGHSEKAKPSQMEKHKT